MIIKKRTLYIFFISLAVFMPSLFTYLGYGSIVSIYINIIALISLLKWCSSRCPIDKWLFSIFLFIGVLSVVTYLHENTISEIVGSYMRLTAFIIILWMYTKKDLWGTVSVIKNVLGVLVFINLMTLILAPNGIIQLNREANEWYEYSVPLWLFGNKNSMMTWLMPANLLVQAECIKNRRKKLWDYLIVIATILTALLSKSSTTTISIAIMTCVFFFQAGINKITNKINSKLIVMGYLVFQILLITSNELGIFRLISGIFGKDVTFTGRTTAWSQCIKLIMENPLMGYGHITEESGRALLGAYAFVNAHNTLLNTMLIGGVVAAVIYIWLIVKSIRKTDQMDNKNMASILKITSISLFLQASFEAYTEVIIFWVILLFIYMLSKAKYVQVGDKND